MANKLATTTANPPAGTTPTTPAAQAAAAYVAMKQEMLKNV